MSASITFSEESSYLEKPKVWDRTAKLAVYEKSLLRVLT